VRSHSGPENDPDSRWRRGILTVDAFVERIYRTGCVQSVILNTALLLALAMLVVRPATDPDRVALTLDFQASAEPSIDLDAAPALALLEEDAPPEEQAHAPLQDPVALEDAPSPPIEVVQVDFESLDAQPVAEHALADLLATVPSPPSLRAPRPIPPAGLAHEPNGNNVGMAPGIGGELGRRLRLAGAKTGDVQVSIRWDGIDDIDVHLLVESLERPGAESRINWMNRFGRCGGMLDVDANAGLPLTNQPVENIFWGKGQAPYARYTVMIHHFRSWSGRLQTPVEVAVLVDGDVQRFYPTAVSGDGLQLITSFVRHRPKVDVVDSRPIRPLVPEAFP
jgi:hypothetical protein